MAAEIASVNYLDPEDLRNDLQLPAGEHADRLASFATEASREVDRELAIYADRMPLEPGDDAWGMARDSAMAWGRYRWFDHMFQAAKSEAYLKVFGSRIKRLQKLLEKRPTAKHAFRTSKTDIAGRRIIPHSQIMWGGADPDLLQ